MNEMKKNDYLSKLTNVEVQLLSNYIRPTPYPPESLYSENL